MDQRKLNDANMTLHQASGDRSNRILWIIIAIVVGVVFIVAVVAFWWWKRSTGNGTYPYIPAPRNTIRSISLPDLLSNIILDVNETAVDYSVISRSEIKWI